MQLPRSEKYDVPVQGRLAGGVRGITLNDGDEVVFAAQQNGEGEIIVVTTLGGFKRVISSLFDTRSTRCVLRFRPL